MDELPIADDFPPPPNPSENGGAARGAHPDGAPRRAIPRCADPRPATPYDGGPSPLSRAISGTLRLTLGPLVHHVPGHSLIIRTARTTVDIASRLVRPDPRVRVRLADDLYRDTGRVLGEWVEPRDAEAEPSDGAVLYLHGGGYVVCSPRTHRPITARLAADTGLPVLVPEYRLAPEHPFPAALEDALDAYRWLLDRGVPPDRLVIAGDSAGGHLAASLTGEICRTGLPRPAGVVLYSPWVDLTCELSTREQQLVRDPYISAATARRVARLVIGAADLEDPRLALLTCRWGGTPPFLIQVGSQEVLRPEAEALAEAITEAGGDCALQVWNGQMHVFQILNRVLPEASAAMDETARFVRSVVGTTAAEGKATTGRQATRPKTTGRKAAARGKSAARGRAAVRRRPAAGGSAEGEAVA